MFRLFKIYFRNLALVVTYLTVIAGIMFILASAVIFCLGSLLVGVLGLAAGALLLWAARSLVELFGLIPNQ
ncbi:MAG: hypothetical protein ACI4OE_07650 [Alphaproteobacteria bacterium]|nr:hypothetical protein [Alphaproteobacteria bacterium]MDY4690202.1 hypothetical protein [Alphaproteobacteria bacterium]